MSISTDTFAQERGDKAPDQISLTLDYVEDLLRGRLMISELPKGVTVFGSARTVEGNADYEGAREFGKLLAASGHAVVTGGGGGIMEAANRGAFEAGGVSIGLNIELPREQHLNEFTTHSHQFKYFFSRKLCLLDASKAYVYFPGGFGTLDELTEIVVMVQTGKAVPLPIILYDSGYWSQFNEFMRDTLLDRKMVSPKDLDIIQLADTPEEVLRIIEKG